MTDLNMTWLKAAIIRAIKTFAQVAAGGIGVGMAWTDVQWGYIFSVAAASAVLSLLTSIAGLPETTTVGTLQYDRYEHEGNSNVYYIDVPADLEPKDGEIVSFKVKRG